MAITLMALAIAFAIVVGVAGCSTSDATAVPAVGGELDVLKNEKEVLMDENASLRERLRESEEEISRLRQWWMSDIDNAFFQLSEALVHLEGLRRRQLVSDQCFSEKWFGAYEAAEVFWRALEAYRLSDRKRAEDREYLRQVRGSIEDLLRTMMQEERLYKERMAWEDERSYLAELHEWVGGIVLGDPPRPLPHPGG